MKQLWVGVFGAVIGGFILFLLQQGYQTWSDQGKFRVNFEKSPEITVKYDELDKIKSQLRGEYDGPIQFRLISANNTGEKDLENVSFSYPASGVLLAKKMKTFRMKIPIMWKYLVVMA